MKHYLKKAHINRLRHRRDLFLTLTFLLCVILIIESLLVMKLSNDTKVVVIPTNLSSPAVFDNHGASKGVIADMARYYADLFLNASPSNADYRTEQILKLTAPDSHAMMKNMLIEQSETLQKNKATTAFYPTAVKPDEKAMSAIISGKLNVYVGSHLAKSLNKTYRIVFAYQYGLLTLKRFDEVHKND
ncbi:MAG: type IV conjugative transfer system protein TraE [Legionellales bacterium]|nr:type IV conjugative transfer system protein TraE [Legionellales bacterium]|tara:strand:- start:208 stop:771 length:564 start_codon:yes stop_codon:yes gene_type:complete